MPTSRKRVVLAPCFIAARTHGSGTICPTLESSGFRLACRLRYAFIPVKGVLRSLSARSTGTARLTPLHSARDGDCKRCLLTADGRYIRVVCFRCCFDTVLLAIGTNLSV